MHESDVTSLSRVDGEVGEGSRVINQPNWQHQVGLNRMTRLIRRFLPLFSFTPTKFTPTNFLLSATRLPMLKEFSRLISYDDSTRFQLQNEKKNIKSNPLNISFWILSVSSTRRGEIKINLLFISRCVEEIPCSERVHRLSLVKILPLNVSRDTGLLQLIGKWVTTKYTLRYSKFNEDSGSILPLR